MMAETLGERVAAPSYGLRREGRPRNAAKYGVEPRMAVAAGFVEQKITHATRTDAVGR
jgi:hypothetical protein